MLVRVAFGVVWFGGVVFFHELAPETTMLAAAVMSFVVTAIVFGIAQKLWLLGRRRTY